MTFNNDYSLQGLIVLAFAKNGLEDAIEKMNKKLGNNLVIQIELENYGILNFVPIIFLVFIFKNKSAEVKMLVNKISM